MPPQDVWKFPPVSYRTSALSGCCPALTPLFQLITPSSASGTTDHVQSLDDLFSSFHLSFGFPSFLPLPFHTFSFQPFLPHSSFTSSFLLSSLCPFPPFPYNIPPFLSSFFLYFLLSFPFFLPFPPFLLSFTTFKPQIPVKCFKFFSFARCFLSFDWLVARLQTLSLDLVEWNETISLDTNLVSKYSCMQANTALSFDQLLEFHSVIG